MRHSISPPFCRCISSLFKIILKRAYELLSKSDILFSTRGKPSDNVVFPPFHHRIIFGGRRKHAACSVPAVLLLLKIVVLLPSLIHSIVWGGWGGSERGGS